MRIKKDVKFLTKLLHQIVFARAILLFRKQYKTIAIIHKTIMKTASKMTSKITPHNHVKNILNTGIPIKNQDLLRLML